MIKPNLSTCRHIFSSPSPICPLSIFFNITYMNKKWGGEDVPFYSGPGSHGEITGPYVDAIAKYIREHNVSSVVDLGCGDFNIGRQLTQILPQIKYTGVDIFEEIIEYNNRNFGSDHISFLCIDTTSKQVPHADLLLIRDVLQHFANLSI